MHVVKYCITALLRKIIQPCISIAYIYYNRVQFECAIRVLAVLDNPGNRGFTEATLYFPSLNKPYIMVIRILSARPFD